MDILYLIKDVAITWLQIFLTFALTTSLLKINVKWWVILLCSAVIAPISSENPLLMLVIFFGGSFAFYAIASRMQVKLSILSMALHLFSSMFIGNIVIFAFLIITPYRWQSVDFMRIFSVIVYVALLCIIKYKKIDIPNLTNNKTIFTLTSAMMLVGIAVYSNLPALSEIVLDYTYILNWFLMFVIQLSVIFLIFTLNKFSKEIEQHEFHRMYTDTLEESLDELIFFKHDSRNIISSLVGFCKLGQWDKVKERLEELADDVRYISAVENITGALKNNMPYLYGIVLSATARAASSGINFHVNVNAKKFELQTVGESKLSRMVGNLLNNALEAAMESQEKEIDLTITNIMDDRIKIIISNSVDAKVDTSRLTEKGYSTKSKEHKSRADEFYEMLEIARENKSRGYGLYEIQTIVKNERKAGWNVKFELTCTDDTFTAELLI